ncbi:MAG: hypothetical protein AAFY74_20465 [Pseudomonadota bacterium]
MVQFDTRNFRLQLDLDSPVRAAQQAFEDTAFLLGIEFTKAITAPEYDWPQGESPRDIVNFGQLRSSQRLVFDGPFTARYEWNTEYAAYVYFGYETRAGNVFPGRPWVEKALETTDIAARYQALYLRYSVG